MSRLATADAALRLTFDPGAPPIPPAGWLIAAAVALVLAVGVEQALVGALRRLLLRREPMVSDGHAVAGYERSLWSWDSRDVRWLWAGLGLTATCATLAVLVDPLWTVTTLAALAACVQWDLATWECVAISPWQIAWRRGWRRSVRRVPTAEVARVHVVDRAAGRARRGTRPPGLLARVADLPALKALPGLSGGSCYLALELHDGRAVKLPRTDRWRGRPAVQQACEVLRQRLHARQQARRDAARSQQRAATRRAHRPHAAVDEVAAIAQLRATRQRQARQQALSAHHELPPPDPTRPASLDTLMPG